MIIYSPLDGDALTHSVKSNPRHCFLMTRLGSHVPEEVDNIRTEITELCEKYNYEVIDAGSRVSGRDFLLKIWQLIASSPLSIGICHEEIPEKTQANIYYEIGVAQGLGKETLLVKSPEVNVPSDFNRTEYVEYNESFSENFSAYFKTLFEQADHYETVADQLDRNPILALDYYKRAFLISGDKRLREKAKELLNQTELNDRAKNSVELLAAEF